MNPRAVELQDRIHRFFLRVIRFCEALPGGDVVHSIRPQLLDAAGSTDSNYRAACKARTRKEFISKIGVAAEEADECCGWLSAMLASGYGDKSEGQCLVKESDELTRILVSSHKTASQRYEAMDAASRRRRRRR